MSPKILVLTNRATKSTELVNPFRVNRWIPVAPPTQQPHLAGTLGTEVSFTGRDKLIVNETIDEIRRMILDLKPRRKRKTETAGQIALPV